MENKDVFFRNEEIEDIVRFAFENREKVVLFGCAIIILASIIKNHDHKE